MKKIIICLTTCVVVSGLVSCGGECGNYFQKPANVKPIDKENYNDVYTVYWNYFDKVSLPLDTEPPLSYDTVLMCGYVAVYGMDKSDSLLWYPKLIDDSIKAMYYSNAEPEVYFYGIDAISDQVKILINNSIPNKCYIKGIVEFDFIQQGACDIHSVPKLKITDIENIHFKNN